MLKPRVYRREGAVSHLCWPLSEPCLRGTGRYRWQWQRDRVCSIDPKSLQHYQSWQLPRAGEGTNCCTSSVHAPFSFPWNHSPQQWSQQYRMATWPCPHCSKLCPLSSAQTLGPENSKQLLQQILKKCWIFTSIWKNFPEETKSLLSQHISI